MPVLRRTGGLSAGRTHVLAGNLARACEQLMTNGLATDAAMDNWRGPAAFAVLDGPLAEVLGVRLDARAADCAACWRLLSGDERERANRFRYAEHRQHYIVARGSLRRLLAD